MPLLVNLINFFLYLFYDFIHNGLVEFINARKSSGHFRVFMKMIGLFVDWSIMHV